MLRTFLPVLAVCASLSSALADGVSGPGLPSIGGGAALSFPPSSGGGGPSLQLDPNANSHGLANAAGTTIPISGISTTNSNDCMYVAVSDLGVGTLSVADTAGLTWTARSGGTYSGGGHVINIWTAVAASPLSSDTITVSNTSGFSYSTAIVAAFSGCNTSSLFDPSVSATPVVASPDPASISTTLANNIIIGFCNSGNNANSAGGGFTLIAANDYSAMEYKVVSSSQAGLSVGWITGSGSCHVMTADAIQ